MILRDHPHEVWVRPERKDDLKRPHQVKISPSGRPTNVGSQAPKRTKLLRLRNAISRLFRHSELKLPYIM